VGGLDRPTMHQSAKVNLSEADKLLYECIQGFPEKTADSLTDRNFATVNHRVARFSPKLIGNMKNVCQQLVSELLLKHQCWYFFKAQHDRNKVWQGQTSQKRCSA